MQPSSELFPIGVLRTVRSLSAWHQSLGVGGPLGLWRSLFHGQGEEFRELREYSEGDDLRNLDWPATARTGHLHVRTYDADRSTPLLIVMDASASMKNGTGSFSRYEAAVRMALVLALLSVQQRDPVGLYICGAAEEYYLKPTVSAQQAGLIAQKLWDCTSAKGSVDWEQSMARVRALCPKKHALVFISDLMEQDELWQPLRLLAQGHFLLVLGVRDQMDQQIPWMGSRASRNPEKGTWKLVSCPLPWFWRKRNQSRWENLAQKVRDLGARYHEICSSDPWEQTSLGLERILEGG